MVEGEIRHSGKIIDITPSEIIVEIVSQSACSSCHAASLCGMSEMEKKRIEVPATTGYEIGEEVWVNLKRSMGMKAVWIAYVLPLFMLIADILILSATGASELLCGLSAIGVIAIYYLGVYLLRNKLKNEYTFYIKKK